jgi:hypothetical protein
VTGRATFGDFLRAAHRALAGGTDLPSPTHGDVGEVSRSLLRLVTIVGRYLQDVVTTASEVAGNPPALAGPWDRARGQAREALTNSAGYLIGPGISGRNWPAAPSASPLAQCLDHVAASLTTGRDLLHTHFAPGPKGWVHQSPWAPVIACERVNRALLAELGALAAPIAHHGANVALAPIPGAPESTDRRRRLNAACQWLWVLSASVEAARRAEPLPAADHDLLAAIPVNVPPQRLLLEAAETVPGLCEGVIATAERLRHLAWHAAQQPPRSPGLTVTSARQAAETSTVSSHNCALIARALAGSHGASPGISADLAAAADTARQAGGSWYQIARALRQVTTDTRGHLSPAAAEARDLALWTGRLAYTDPTWTPASGPHHSTRPPHELAARAGDVPQVVAAIHHASEALTLLAETEHDQLRAATHAGRILVPTRSLPDDYNIPRPYATALPEHTAPLLARCRDATQAARQATTSIGRAAEATGAPSRTLATARAATQATPSASLAANPDSQATPGGREQTRDMPGPLQQALLGLGISSPSLLTRGADLDQASQHLLIEAADELPPAHQRSPAATLNTTAGSATLLNHALASGDPKAARLLRQPDQAEREEPEPEP